MLAIPPLSAIDSCLRQIASRLRSVLCAIGPCVAITSTGAAGGISRGKYASWRKYPWSNKVIQELALWLLHAQCLNILNVRLTV